jgi:hypothetical protein
MKFVSVLSWPKFLNLCKNGDDDDDDVVVLVMQGVFKTVKLAALLN